VPSLQGRSATQADGLDARAAAAQLLAALQARQPQAGRAFWALRAWARLVWQPACASVLAVELADAVLPLNGMRWQLDPAEVDVTGFVLPAADFATAEPGLRVVQAAQQLQALSAVLLVAVQACIPLHPKAARRMLADCVLGALLRSQRATGRSPAALQALGRDWLGPLGATGDSGFLSFETAAQGPRLALDRGICCLDDRRTGGELCTTCPRLPRAERLRRLCAQDAPVGHGRRTLNL
jgi:siderophore ferric iron reductase